MRGKKELLEKITKKEKVKSFNDTLDCDMSMALVPVKKARPQDVQDYSVQCHSYDKQNKIDRRLDDLEALVREACAR